VAQTGITSFIQWYENPQAQPWVAADVFGNAPRELLRSVSLQETLQLIRVVVEVVESRVVAEYPELRESILRYSRDIAFNAADVYARAAEARGLWDARLEALVVDSIVSGEPGQEINSRVSALGWRSEGQVCVVIGSVAPNHDPDGLRKVSRKQGAELLLGVHGNRQILVLGLVAKSDAPDNAFTDLVKELDAHFGPGPVVIGTTVLSVVDANRSARSALSANSVVGAGPALGRIVQADQLLAERALAGDKLAKTTLIDALYLPLANDAPDLLHTLRTYLNNGGSLEATSKSLFVHANTVRYRLKRIFEAINLDPTEPRSAFVLQVALVLGSINDVENGTKR
jgi:sugar diacid utilization regulator